MRALAPTLVLIAVLAALTACGRKGAPRPVAALPELTVEAPFWSLTRDFA